MSRLARAKRAAQRALRVKGAVFAVRGRVCQTVPRAARAAQRARVSSANAAHTTRIAALTCGATVFGALCAASPAAAQARVAVPAGCGSEHELRRELARLLGPDRVQDALPEQLRIEPAGANGFALALELRGESRALHDPDCRALFDSAVVVAAAALDPRIETRERPARSVAAPALAATASGPSPAATAAWRPRADGDWRAGAAIGAGAAFGLLPRAAPTLELSGNLVWGSLGLALSARYLARADGYADDSHGVAIHGFGARIAGLYDPVPFVRLQAGVALDRLTGRGLGTAVELASDSGTAFALALEASVIPLRVGATRLSLGVLGHYALVRPSFEIEGYGEVYRVPRIGIGGIARLGWEFH